MSDDRVQQVIDELDPTPASEAAWPVSRRQTLRALAAAGLLGAGSSSASAESAGTVIADEAFLSNYGSESVSDGWELTIDDDVFALTESEETIGLPDGGVGEELVLPNGAEASEMLAPDGSVVFEDPIPDSAIAQWISTNGVISDGSSANDGDTIDEWLDQLDNNNATGGSPTYLTDELNGEPTLDFDGSDDFAIDEIEAHAVTVVAQASSSFDEPILGDSDSNTNYFAVYDGNIIFRAEDDAASFSVDVSQGEWVIASAYRDESGDVRAYLNGSPSPDNPQSAGPIYSDLIGSRESSDYYPESMAAIVPFDETVTREDQEEVEQDLSNTYGIQLD